VARAVAIDLEASMIVFSLQQIDEDDDAFGKRMADCDSTLSVAPNSRDDVGTNNNCRKGYYGEGKPANQRTAKNQVVSTFKRP
jgi:hypothetical protein